MIFSGNTQKLKSADLLAQKLKPFGISGKFGEKMLVDQIPSKGIYYEKPFILDR